MATSIYFTDEDFFARPVEEMRELAETYASRVGLPFECMASPLQITKEKMALLSKAGMWRIDIGVESGSDDVKKRIFNRPADNKTVMRAATAVSQSPHVVPYYFFIIGNPYEQRQDLLDTIDLLMQIPTPYFLRCYNLVFIPGTRLFERACLDGIIAGLGDCGYEMDFVSGLSYKGHTWKTTNLYLNSLIALMAGKSTRLRLGFIPKLFIPILVHPRLIDFCDRHVALAKILVNLGNLGLRLRRTGLAMFTGILGDNKLAYGLRFLSRRAHRATAPSKLISTE